MQRLSSSSAQYALAYSLAKKFHSSNVRNKDSQPTVTSSKMASSRSYFKRPIFKFIEEKEDVIVNVDQVHFNATNVLERGVESQVAFRGDREQQIGSMVVKGDKVQWKNAYGRAVFTMAFIELKCALPPWTSLMISSQVQLSDRVRRRKNVYNCNWCLISVSRGRLLSSAKMDVVLRRRGERLSKEQFNA